MTYDICWMFVIHPQVQRRKLTLITGSIGGKNTFTAFLHFFKLTVNTGTLLYIHFLGRGQKQGCHRLVLEGKQTPD